MDWKTDHCPKRFKRTIAQVISVLALVSLVMAPDVLAQGGNVARVPEDFSYPRYGDSAQFQEPFAARNLSGQVILPGGGGLEKVLVELMSPGWKKRVDAVFTDAEGHFDLNRSTKGTYYLRFSLLYFGLVMAKVKIIKKAAKGVIIELPVAN
ncbi:MAG: carboxypeptidase-like regulatory domain-containing protein [Pyrinomonadaceae bacterium]